MLMHCGWAFNLGWGDQLEAFAKETKLWHYFLHSISKWLLCYSFSLIVSVYLTQVFLFGWRMVVLETFFHLTLEKSMAMNFVHLSVISLVSFQFGKCWDSSVETALCEVMKNTYTVGLPPWVTSTIAFCYLGTWVNVINQCTLEATTGTPLMTAKVL